jgi:PCO_ADO
MYNRRTILRNCAGFLGFALVAELSIAGSRTSSLSARRWMLLQRDMAHELRDGSLNQLQWHEGVNSLAREIDLEQLAAELRRARIKNANKPFGHDPQKRFVTILDEQKLPVKLGYSLALFDFRADSVITPHAHKHMVSAHTVIDGRVRIRTFDRIQDEDGALVIRPTLDVVAEPGLSAAMTTPKDNVHWFAPRTARAMTVDVIIDGLDAGQDSYLIQPVDPLGGQELADGTIRAPLISFERSMELYTARR